MTNLTQERLRLLMRYDPDSGIFIRRIKAGGVSAGTAVGCKRRDGYLICSVDNKLYLMHQLVWLYVFCYMPKLPSQIDHINRDRSDNRLSNLRECDYHQNNWNQGKKSTNRSGVPGVHWDKHKKKWMATIRVNSKTKFLGRFDGIHEAGNAYNVAVKANRGSFLGETA